MKLALVVLLVVSAVCAQTVPTVILDSVIRDVSGSMFVGTITITPRSVAPAGVTIGPSNPVFRVNSGILRATLYPGTYTATYTSDGGGC